MVILNTFSGSCVTKNTYPTKAEFVETMRQLHGNLVAFRNMQGMQDSIDNLVDGQIWIDGKYVGFWIVEFK